MHAAPFVWAQVFVAGLQAWLVQTARAVGPLQTASCRVSATSALPGAPSATHAFWSRRQCCVSAQSASTQQLPLCAGMQTPEVLHVVDWHAEASAMVQPAWPSARSHRWLAPHWLLTHWAAVAQATLLPAAQVFVVGLQAPVAHVASPSVLQTPVCSPSEGIVAPASSFARQVNAPRSQNWLARQSWSTKQPPGGAQTFDGVHAPDWHNVAPVCAVQPA